MCIQVAQAKVEHFVQGVLLTVTKIYEEAETEIHGKIPIQVTFTVTYGKLLSAGVIFFTVSFYARSPQPQRHSLVRKCELGWEREKPVAAAKRTAQK